MSSSSRILLEVCVDNVDGLLAAVEGGADRIELCSALEVGGLTPTPGLMQMAAMLAGSVPVFALIRPRSGDFVYSDKEVETMLLDIDAVREAGLSGVVLGANAREGELDVRTLRLLVDRAKGLSTTLHRCIDLVPDISAATEVAIELGFQRILTSGGAQSALDGIEGLKSASTAASGRISIMPGGGVKASNVEKLWTEVPFRDVHSSCSVARPASSAKVAGLGFVTSGSKQTCAIEVRDLRDRINDLLSIGKS